MISSMDQENIRFPNQVSEENPKSLVKDCTNIYEELTYLQNELHQAHPTRETGGP